MAVEQDEETRDADLQIEVLVDEEAPDQCGAVVAGCWRHWSFGFEMRHAQITLRESAGATPHDERADVIAGGAAGHEPFVEDRLIEILEVSCPGGHPSEPVDQVQCHRDALAGVAGLAGRQALRVCESLQSSPHGPSCERSDERGLLSRSIVEPLVKPVIEPAHLE